NLGQIRVLQGRAGEAEDCFRRAVEIAPGYATGWNNLGVATYARDDTAAAVAAFRKALELDPCHLQSNTNLGSILKNFGQLDEAAACFDRVLTRDPGNDKVRLMRATLLPPILLSVEELDRIREALSKNVAALLAEGVRLDPDREEMPG